MQAGNQLPWQTHRRALHLHVHSARQLRLPAYIVGVTLAAAGAIYVVLVCGICLARPHRMLGPEVAMRRQVEALASGDSSARVELREGDAFAALARKLNELASILEGAAKGGSPAV